MYRPHYDHHLTNTLAHSRNNKKISDDEFYMLDRPYYNTVDLAVLPRLASPAHIDEDVVYLPDKHINGITPAGYADLIDTEALLRLKWMDNSPRMSRLRETRRRRLVNKLEVIIKLSRLFSLLCFLFLFSKERKK